MNVPPKALVSNLNEVCATNKTEESHECSSPSFESASIHSAAIASLMLNWMVEQPLEKKEEKVKTLWLWICKDSWLPFEMSQPAY